MLFDSRHEDAIYYAWKPLYSLNLPYECNRDTKNVIKWVPFLWNNTNVIVFMCFCHSQGTDLTLASTADDVEVLIGIDEKCTLVLLEPTRLICDMPKNQPEADSEEFNLPSIRVRTRDRYREAVFIWSFSQ